MVLSACPNNSPANYVLEDSFTKNFPASFCILQLIPPNWKVSTKAAQWSVRCCWPPSVADSDAGSVAVVGFEVEWRPEDKGAVILHQYILIVRFRSSPFGSRPWPNM